jgi:tRNA (mo5U34)-methyltransferase
MTNPEGATEALQASHDHLAALTARARAFAKELALKREQLAPAVFWYPYRSMLNFEHLNSLLTGSNRDLFRDINPKRAAEIGAADGDMSFFLEREGWDMTTIDNPPTNWNGLKGVRLYKEFAGSSIRIVEMDLDSQFVLEEQYDIVFFLGILYHLKNPFYILEQLSNSTRYLFLSTRIMRWSAPASLGNGEVTSSPRQLLEHLPLAYLLGPTECNNDNTNYWIFSDRGLKRLIDRTGWEILDYRIIGKADEADPYTSENDARAFCLVRSRSFPN